MRERRPSSTMPSVELAEGTVANPSAAAAAASRGEGLDMTEEHGPSETTSLTKDDHQFLLSVDRGDIVTVHRLLDQKSVNVNCLDLLGRSALLIAIDNDNIEIVDLLLRYGAQIGDAILHAINEDNVEIVELLLANQQKNKKDLRVSFCSSWLRFIDCGGDLRALRYFDRATHQFLQRHVNKAFIRTYWYLWPDDRLV